MRLQHTGSKSLASGQLSKFCLIGVTNVIVGYGSYIFFLHYFSYMGALLISHVIGVTNSYFWNRIWTFKSKKNPLIEIIKFNLVYAIVFMVNALMLIFMVNILNLDPRIGQLIALPIIAVISFTGHKYWSFK